MSRRNRKSAQQRIEARTRRADTAQRARTAEELWRERNGWYAPALAGPISDRTDPMPDVIRRPR